MSYKIIYSKEALQDIRSIYYYISFHLKEQRTAEKIVRNIRDEIKSLNTMPERYSRFDRIDSEYDFRYFSVGNYLVFYLIDEKTVNIIRILYGGQNIEKQFE